MVSDRRGSYAYFSFVVAVGVFFSSCKLYLLSLSYYKSGIYKSWLCDINYFIHTSYCVNMTVQCYLLTHWHLDKTITYYCLPLPVYTTKNIRWAMVLSTDTEMVLVSQPPNSIKGWWVAHFCASAVFVYKNCATHQPLMEFGGWLTRTISVSDYQLFSERLFCILWCNYARINIKNVKLFKSANLLNVNLGYLNKSEPNTPIFSIFGNKIEQVTTRK